MKVCTDLEQSKKLKGILPIESADTYMCRSKDGTAIKIDANSFSTRKQMWEDYFEVIPYWSLAALFNVLPTTIGNFFKKNALRLRMDKGENDFNIWYENLDCGDVVEGLDVIESNPVDACYEMILKLHELNLL